MQKRIKYQLTVSSLISLQNHATFSRILQNLTRGVTDMN